MGDQHLHFYGGPLHGTRQQVADGQHVYEHSSMTEDRCDECGMVRGRQMERSVYEVVFLAAGKRVCVYREDD